MQTIECDVEAISNLTEYVYKVSLTPLQALDFKAGQYLMLILGDDDRRAFSIACAPSQGDCIELHIGAGHEDSYAMGAVAHLKAAFENSERVVIEAPGGSAYLQSDSQRPILLVAGGTGFTYVKSIADQLLAQNSTVAISLYWGVRHEDALYEIERWQECHKQHENFTFIPVVEHHTAEWQGKKGPLIDAVLGDFLSFEEYDIYCAGRFEMVGKAREAFLEKGLDQDRMFGDAFAFIK